MKKLLWLLLLPFTVNASPVLFATDGEVDLFDITQLLLNAQTDPLFSLIPAGSDPNTTTRVPLNFNVFTGQVFDISQEEVFFTEVAPELGGGFAFQTAAAGPVVFDTPEFEVAAFDAFGDAPDWHTATSWEQIGNDAFTLAFNPHPNEGGQQAGLIINDVATFDLPPQDQNPIDTVPVAAVPLPPAVWLFTAGLIGMVGVARRGKIRA